MTRRRIEPRAAVAVPGPRFRSPQRDASEQIAFEIRRYLSTRGLLPGERLGTEQELAAEFGVSRPTLREGLRLLASSHLIRASQGRGGGIFVESTQNEGMGRNVSESIATMLETDSVSLNELLDARVYLEVPLAGLAAENATEQTAVDLQEAIDAAAGNHPGSDAFRVADTRFHRVIAATARNELLRAFTSWTLDVLQPSLIDTIGDSIDGEAILRQHGEIQRAIRLGQPAAAQRAMRRHLEYLRDLVGALEPQSRAVRGAVGPLARIETRETPEGAAFAAARLLFFRRSGGARRPRLLGRGVGDRVPDPLPQQVGRMEELRVVGQLLRRPVVADPAAFEHVGGLGQAEGHMGELLDQEDADAGGRDGLQRRHEALDDNRRQPERELVDEQDRGMRDERLREHDHLLLASREQAPRDGPPLLELGKQLERVCDAPLRVVAAQRVGRDAKVVLDRQLGQKPPSLGDDRDAGAAHLLGAMPREVHVSQQHLAGAGPQHAGNREHERRLPGPVRAEQRRHLARRDLDRDVVNDGAPAPWDRDAFEAQAGCRRRRAHSFSSVPR